MPNIWILPTDLSAGDMPGTCRITCQAIETGKNLKIGFTVEVSEDDNEVAISNRLQEVAVLEYEKCGIKVSTENKKIILSSSEVKQ